MTFGPPPLENISGPLPPATAGFVARPEAYVPSKERPLTQNEPASRRELDYRMHALYRALAPADGPRQVTPQAGVATKLVEVKIAHVVNNSEDAQNPEQLAFFTDNGAFLVCWAYRLDMGVYSPDMTKELFVFPAAHQTAMDYLGPGGTVIFDGLQPVAHVVARMQRGLTMLFGHGEVWVDEPSEEDLCQP